MSGSHHCSALQGLCRLCGDVITERSVKKEKLAKVINRALSLDISIDDDDIHPPSVCYLCDRKLGRWRTWKSRKAGTGRNKRGGDVGIQIRNFEPHVDDCCICTAPQEQEPEPSLLQTCERIGREHDMVVQRRAGKVLLITLDEHGSSAQCLSVCESGLWTLRVYSKLVSKEHTHLKDLDILVTVESVMAVIEAVSKSHICPGNPEYVVSESSIMQRPIYIHRMPDPTKDTMRHTSCPLVTTSDGRCPTCSIYRTDLAKLYKTCEAMNSPALKGNHRYMRKEKLSKRLKTEKTNKKTLNQKLKRLKAQVKKKFNEEAKSVTELESKSFAQVLQQEENSIAKEFPDKSPQQLLWQEQLRRLNRKGTGMRWHPAILRLCIALHAKSAAAYNVLRDSGFLTLPHQTTLFQYTHFTDNPPGLNAQFFQRVCSDIKFSSLQQHEKNIMLSIDEIKVSEGLVFSQSTGEIVGFTSLGTLNDELQKYARDCEGAKEPKMASHILTVMIRAICASYRSPIAYFATLGATSDQLYWIVTESIEYLTHQGFCVRGIVSDGAAPNRGLYKILTEGISDNFFFNSITDDRIYLFGDVPHLIKTIRNNFENSGFNHKTKNLKFRGLDISWKHILDVYEWDFSSPSSLRMLHKLTEEHLHLTPALRMKVKLAAQVLSSTVANALKVQGLPETASTIRFIEYVDTFFDCLNVSTRFGGQRKRKDTLFPYSDQNDWRFTWLTEDLLSYLDEWESEGLILPITARDRERLILSKQTLQGIRMTVNSFVSLCRELLAEEGVQFVLSDKFNQDPLEEYFVKQRSIGRSNENPTVSQFGNNMLSIHVAGMSLRASKRANVTRESGGETSIDCTPIPRKKLFKR
ncbi:uncharacterized protein LOC105444767 isoform X2 [Strongylocentrotus purpuratus]|nr:uncharacterized protein LOC105444767 isoform X2 [Strongylocentrotus purpuratus]